MQIKIFLAILLELFILFIFTAFVTNAIIKCISFYIKSNSDYSVFLSNSITFSILFATFIVIICILTINNLRKSSKNTKETSDNILEKFTSFQLSTHAHYSYHRCLDPALLDILNDIQKTTGIYTQSFTS